jgi:hypothetical protein
MHRVNWDLRYQPLGEGGGRGGGSAAVPHRTYPSVNAPWAPPGNYTVRLTVEGKTYAQPLVLHLDPRVKTSPLGVSTLNALTREMYTGARKLRAAAEDGRALASELNAVEGAEADAMKKTLTEIAQAAPAGGGRGGFGAGGRGGRGGGTEAAATLDSVSAQMMSAAMAMQAADTAPTAREAAACAEARRQSAAVLAKWTKVSTVDLAALNAARKSAGQPAIAIPRR